MDARELAAVFASGAGGALARVLLVEALPAQPGHWPWATFVANVAGAFVLGSLTARETQRHRFLATGVCGALTTFSTLQLELLAMFDGARVGLAAAYALASVTLGLAAVALGRRL